MGRLYGVFPHASVHSCALSKFEQLPLRRQRKTVWIYLPIGREDAILSLGMREDDEEGLCIMVSSIPCLVEAF